MAILIGFLYVIEVATCVLLALVVMLQKPKEGGLGGLAGGSSMEATLGADAGSILIKATAILGTVFLLNTLLLAKLTSTPASNSVVAGSETTPAAEAPVLPDLPVAPEVPANGN
mgnify:CR=1 FL=1